jgi:hypothetical protein
MCVICALCLIVVSLSPGKTYLQFKYNSIQFFIIYVPSQQPQGQLKTEHRVDTSNNIMYKHNVKSKTNYRQALEENTIMQTSKQTDKQQQ